MNTQSLTGSCLCGAVRYAISGGFATWGILDPEQFQWTQGENQVRWDASSAMASGSDQASGVREPRC